MAAVRVSFQLSKQLTLILDDRGGPAVRAAVRAPPWSQGAVLHSSGGLQHHGGETYLHRVRTGVAATSAPGRRRVDGVGGDAPRAGRVLLYVELLAENAKNSVALSWVAIWKWAGLSSGAETIYSDALQF